MIISMTAGTMFLVWIGELMSERGIGNGISILIFAGIIAGLPQFVAAQLYTGTGEGVFTTIALGALVFGLVAYIVFFQGAVAVAPYVFSNLVGASGQGGQGRQTAFGITSSGLIIVVGVVLDTLRQIEAPRP